MPTDIRGSQVKAPGDDAGGTVGRDVSRDKGGDQAAWRDLVARLELSASVDPASAPWPDRENLTRTADRGVRPPEDESADQGDRRPPRVDSDGGRPGHDSTGQRTGDRRTRDRGHVVRPANSPRRENGAQDGAAPRFTASQIGPRSAGQIGPRSAEQPGPDDYPDTPTSPDMGILDFLDADDDPGDPEDRYVPPPVPPLPRLDPVAKGAWTALFGGPGYLLLATMLGWQVPGWAELLAVAAFVIGFVVLVSRLGDGPSRRDGPDQGAVV